MVVVINEMNARGYTLVSVDSNHNPENVTEVTHKLVFTS